MNMEGDQGGGTRAATIHGICLHRHHHPIGSSSLSQALATELLSSGIYEKHVQFVREQLRIRRNTTISALQKHMVDIADWKIPSGGFGIWLRLRSSISSHEPFEKALKEGILLNPGTIYDRQANSYLRISYAYATLNEIGNGIEKLASLVRQLSCDASKA